MSISDTAAAVFECVGGFPNVIGSSLCATRLRISLRDSSLVERTALQSINGVLGIANRNANDIEVVFGPNLVRGVFQAFEQLIGPASQQDGAPEAVHTRPASNFQVMITPETPGAPQVQGSVTRPVEMPVAVEDDDTNALLEMLEGATNTLADTFDELDLGPRLLVINGPNINMLGVGDSKLFGDVDLTTLLDCCHEAAHEAGFVDCECYQSNHEGDLVDYVQDAFDLFDAIVINPGAYAHTSIALHDALVMVGVPAVEVHLSYASERTDFRLRRHSYVGEACLQTIEGLGIAGYREAIFILARHLGITEQASTT